MDMTGWVSGQVFLQTVDGTEVERVTEFLNARGLAFQVLTLSERMTVGVEDPTGPGALGEVSADRFSIAIHVSGFPQVVGPLLSDLVQRTHGAGWSHTTPDD